MSGNTMELIVFEHEVDRVLPLLAAGLTDFMVDIERRGKNRRQLGADTEISEAPLQAIQGLAKLPNVRVHCRVNSWSRRAADEVREAIDLGATRVYLPMVERREEIEQFLGVVNGKAEAAILIETEMAVRHSNQFSDLPIDAVFVGLNDLAICRGNSNIFQAIADGTVANIRRALPKPQFGFGGVTCVDLGTPVPSRLLVASMAALDADFAFLRRSFRRDIVGRDIAQEVTRIRTLWADLLLRAPERIRRDHDELMTAIEALAL